MRRAIHRLNARMVGKNLKPGRHGDGGGLYLNVAASGSTSWIFLYRRDGRRIEMGLGPYPSISIARAREFAAEARRELAEGRDPLTLKRQARAGGAPTFKEFAEAYIETMAPAWKNEKHGDQWRMTIREYAAQLHKKRLDAIGTDDILEVLKPVWTAKAETASRLRGRLEAILDAAKAKGHRAGDNPARWRGHLDRLLPARAKLQRGHMAAMPFADLPAFVATFREAPSVTAAALEFLILTAARSGEVRGARWPEIDLKGQVWTVPAERMKAARDHRVPLSGRAVAILEAAKKWPRRGDDDLVFPSLKPGQPLSDMSLTVFLRKRGLEFTAHGFRSSFRDWCGEKTSFPRDLAEQALAHVVGDETERAYRRGDALERRRKMMEAWAQFVGASVQSNVIAIARRS